MNENLKIFNRLVQEWQLLTGELERTESSRVRSTIPLKHLSCPRFMRRLGSAQNPIKGTSTLNNPIACRYAPTLNFGLKKHTQPSAWSRALPDRWIKIICPYGSILQGLGQSTETL
ncbi:hypothetical protein [Lentisphaera araneosa]|uniref:hypothetical protein n=1 Tax=Lentisphaera araneosa TaxID=256847 RepID=UPI0012FC35B2|nr:hypothetical protein [Lentisphaera araneosa]